MTGPGVVQARLDDLRGRIGRSAVALAAHLAIPVAVTPTLLNLVRNRFFIDPPEVLGYQVEAQLLLSPLFRSIGGDLYQMEPDYREVLLADLDVRYGPGRARQVAELLYHYSTRTAAWSGYPQLEAAQQLTALGLIDPDGAARVLQSAPAGTERTDGSRWRVAMRRHLDRLTAATPSHYFEAASQAAEDEDWTRFDDLVAAGIGSLPVRSEPTASVLRVIDFALERPEAFFHQNALPGIIAELGERLDEPLRGRFAETGRRLSTEAQLKINPSAIPLRTVAITRELNDLRAEIGRLTPGIIVSRERRATWAVERTRAPIVWSEIGAIGAGVRVAVVADGIRSDLSVFGGRVVGRAAFDDGGRPIDEPVPDGGIGHGTAVGGAVAGGEVGGRVIGAAPGAELVDVSVLSGQGAGSVAQILGGLDWAVGQRPDVIVVPLGLRADKDLAEHAVEVAADAGIVVVAAIGNEGPNAVTSPGSSPRVLGVGATDRADQVAAFSGGMPSKRISAGKPDVVAPGVECPVIRPDGRLDTQSGTSFSCGYVAGVVALLLGATTIREQTAGAERTSVVNRLVTGSARPLGDLVRSDRYGSGLVDAYGAIQEAWRTGYS